MAHELAYVNGKLLPVAEAAVPVHDRSFLYGDGAFDTAVARQGRVFKLDAHLARLFRSLRVLRIPPPLPAPPAPPPSSPHAPRIAAVAQSTARWARMTPIVRPVGVERDDNLESWGVSRTLRASRVGRRRPDRPPAGRTG